MLNKLKTHHANVLALIDALEALTAEPAPVLAEVAAVRMKLTRASRLRTAFLDEDIYPALLQGCAASELMPVRALRESGNDRRAASTEHIRQWTLAALEDHWTDYCAASRAMRASMRTRIREEQAVLYPLLQPVRAQQASRR